jgi:hypothetical protein
MSSPNSAERPSLFEKIWKYRKARIKINLKKELVYFKDLNILVDVIFF